MDVSGALDGLYEETAVLVALYDPDDRLRYANRAFRTAFSVETGETPLWPELMRRNFMAGRGTIIRAADFDAWLLSAQSRRGKTGYRAFETDLADGRWLWMTETVQASGWMLCIASDITALRPDERTVRQDRDFAIKASQTDELTGVSNRRFVMARIEDMLRTKRPEYETPGCIGILDIDHFKDINDRFGHQTGDVVLSEFARRIHAQVRRTDCFGRVGGEEFVLVLPGTRIQDAEAIVARMLDTIRGSRPLPDRPEFAYTFSAGVAAGRSGDTASDLYTRADRALYAAKLAGRNCIRLDGAG